MSTELRDWRPGDGLTCTYSKRSPIPCGRPVKTAVSQQQSRPQGPLRTVRRPLCEHHTAGRMGGLKPGEARAAAERNAYQRLAHEHWDEFTAHVAAELKALQQPGE